MVKLLISGGKPNIDGNLRVTLETQFTTLILGGEISEKDDIPINEGRLSSIIINELIFPESKVGLSSTTKSKISPAHEKIGRAHV